MCILNETLIIEVTFVGLKWYKTTITTTNNKPLMLL